jgi:hypothetical protein
LSCHQKSEKEEEETEAAEEEAILGIRKTKVEAIKEEGQSNQKDRRRISPKKHQRIRPNQSLTNPRDLPEITRNRAEVRILPEIRIKEKVVEEEAIEIQITKNKY